MVSTPASKQPAAIIDASFMIGLCANEPNKYAVAKAKLDLYHADGWELFTPGIAIGEVLYVLCKKLKDNTLDLTQHANAVRRFVSMMASIKPPPTGDASLIDRAEQIRSSYGCARANDAFYIALAEQLAIDRPSTLITFDADMAKQAKANAVTVVVEVLPVSIP